MFAFLKPPPPKTALPENKVDGTYKCLRMQVFAGIFVGYAGYYLVRKNFSLAMPYLAEEGFTKADLGWAISAISIAYGLSKFLMGSVSDRSNARVFLALGLLLSAGITAFMGLCPWALGSIYVMFALLFVNGWVQGMGWPPCGRVMVHWFSAKERGLGMSVWNVAHNVGGGLVATLAIWGMAIFGGDWRSVFYFPAIIAAMVALFAFLTVRDTPQSCGLPPIEIYKKDSRKDYSAEHEREFSARQIFFEHVLNNRALWMIAFANVFIYFVRYGVLDWAPTYLKEVKDFDFKQLGWAYSFYEYAGIPGTILCGLVSDKLFKGRRAPVTLIYMLLTLLMVIVYWLNPAGNPYVDIFALIAIGFLIYGPVMMIGLQALDMVPKKAAGTAAGFTGLFGYLGGAVFANIAMGYAIDHLGWDGSFWMLMAACVLTMLIMLYSFKQELAE